jgi:tetratricopeptide (TPR) repeat protein
MLALFASALAALSAPPAVQQQGAPRIEWTRDAGRAYAEAAERRAPLLIHFRGRNCGIREAPVAIGEGTRPAPAGDLNDCDLMQQEVWENRAVAEVAARFLVVLADTGDEKLKVRYQVAVEPTTLIADPWGTEIFRAARYLEADKMTRLLQAIPSDFQALEPFARALQRDPADVQALMGAAAYYQGERLLQVSERLYDKAARTPKAGADITVRRQVAIARGLNLLLMGRDKDAAGTFEKALEENPSGPGSDALLLGLVNAHLQGRHPREAESALKTLEKGWPGSAYAARARQNFESARAKR